MKEAQSIKWVSNQESAFYGNPTADTSLFSADQVANARRFHASMPHYKPTPLTPLPALAAFLGVKGVYLKDESYRFGLNAFKALGASYAVACIIAEKLGVDPGQMTFEQLTSDETRKSVGELTFATTTDGNHGRAVAWTARALRQRAVVYMPKGSSRRRADAIKNEGASVTIRDCNYDESVRLTAEEAAEKGWIVVQDTAWEGYASIPGQIMQGYGTTAGEACDELRDLGVGAPSHVFAQAGVGSFAGAVQGYLVNACQESAPKMIVVEASSADCFYRSIAAGGAEALAVGGDLDTLMAGLACGEVNPIAYDILRDYSAAFVSCPDYVAAHGMRLLGNPLAGDRGVCSGESGAVTAGLLSFIMRDRNLFGLRQSLGLDESSIVLLFSTEGDTDPERYRSVVWDGEFPTFGIRDSM